MIAAEMRRARSRAREMSRRVAREAARELTGGEKTALYVAGGVGALALGIWALTRKTSPMIPPASSASSTTTTTTPGSSTTTTTPGAATPGGTPVPGTSPTTPSTTTPSTPSTPSSPTSTPPSTPAAPAAVNPAAQTYVTGAFNGSALPWNPPANAVSIASTVAPTVAVTDPTLIAMAQHALWYIGTQAAANGTTLSTSYPISDPGGITGNISPTFTSALAALQSGLTASSSLQLFSNGNTSLNTSGTLDYKTLGVLIFVAMIYYAKQTGSAGSSNTSGLSSQFINVATAGLSKIVGSSWSASQITSQLNNAEATVASSLGFQGTGFLFSPSGQWNWAAWSAFTGLGA